MSHASGLIGEKLGSYRIESVLGSGAMGVVYRATNEKTGRTAAVKVVSGELARGGKIHDRFERESEILQQFRHPSIVRFLAWGRFRGTSYIAMEYVQGVTLEKTLQERGSLPWREVVELGIQICDALHYAHEHGVVHRDLKPSNLMITSDGKLKLTDFGIAKDLDRTALTAPGRTLGTAAYMSPEQIRGTPAVSHKTDLYALGILMHQMLVGKTPFDGSSPVVMMHCHLNEPAPRPSDKVQEIPKALDDLIVALMAKAPADRPWDAAAVGASLNELHEKVARGSPVAMVWPTPGSPESNPPRAGVVSGARDRRKARKTKSAWALSPSALGLYRYGESSSFWISRAALETGLLAAALLAIGGFIAYWVWPESEAYLFHQAEALMASTRRADWMIARDQYLDPLDRRFPANPYREQTAKWRDQIDLTDAEGRATIICSPIKTSFGEPKNNAERQFVLTNTLATTASSRGDDLAAVRHWRELAAGLKADDPEERPWHLLALKRAAAVENEIKDRRAIVEKQLAAAELYRQNGRLSDARVLKSKLQDEYGKYTDLADLFPPPAPSPVPAGSAPKPAPGSETSPATASPPTGASPPSKKEAPAESSEPGEKQTPAEPASHPVPSSASKPSSTDS